MAGLVLSIPRAAIGGESGIFRLSIPIHGQDYRAGNRNKEDKVERKELGVVPRVSALGPNPYGRFVLFNLLAHGLADGPPVSPERGACNQNDGGEQIRVSLHRALGVLARFRPLS